MQFDGERDDESSWNTNDHHESGAFSSHFTIQERQGDLSCSCYKSPQQGRLPLHDVAIQTRRFRISRKSSIILDFRTSKIHKRDGPSTRHVRRVDVELFSLTVIITFPNRKLYGTPGFEYENISF